LSCGYEESFPLAGGGLSPYVIPRRPFWGNLAPLCPAPASPAPGCPQSENSSEGYQALLRLIPLIRCQGINMSTNFISWCTASLFPTYDPLLKFVLV
jgi:hypothetical protein